MSRLYAQVCTLVFLLVGVGGLALGNAGPPPSGGGGNLGGLVVHLTWARDALDIALLVVFVFVGFVAARRAGRVVTAGVGLLLVALAVVGFVLGDDPAGSRAYLGLHFSTALNILDLVVGLLAILAALGTLEDPDPPTRSVLRG